MRFLFEAEPHLSFGRFASFWKDFVAVNLSLLIVPSFRFRFPPHFVALPKEQSFSDTKPSSSLTVLSAKHTLQSV